MIARVLRISDVPTQCDMNSLREWDSLSQIQVMLELEKCAGTRVPADLFGELTSVEAIVSFLAEEGLLAE